MLRPRIMKVDMEVGHVWQIAPIDFGFIRSMSQGPVTVKSSQDDY